MEHLLYSEDSALFNIALGNLLNTIKINVSRSNITGNPT